MNTRGQYGKNSRQPWPATWGQSSFVGASDQLQAEYQAIKLANAASAPSVTRPVTVTPPVAVTQERAVVTRPTSGVSLWSIAKYGAIGALVVGGAVAVSSLFTTVKKGKEPVRYYSDLYREHRKT